MSELFDDLDAPPEQQNDVILCKESNFVLIPEEIIDLYGKQLGPIGIACYVALKSHANRKQGMRTFVAVKTIAEEINCGISTVRREFAKMSELGLLTRELRKHHSTIYFIENLKQLAPPHGVLAPPHSATPPPYGDITIRTNHKNLTNPPTPKKTRRTRGEIFASYHPDTKPTVNDLIEIWPKVRPGNKSPIKIDIPLLANRLDELLQNPHLDRGLLLAAAKRYLSEGKEFLHAPEYFFGPGKSGSDGPPWRAYAKMEYYERNKPVKVLGTAAGSVN